MMGDGVAIVQDGKSIAAPCSGILSMLYPTLHAFGMTSDDGMEVLVHIGIDTVNLKGKGFESVVREGQHINAGETVVKLDVQYMREREIDLTTMILFPNSHSNIQMKREGYAKKGKTIIATYNRSEKEIEKQEEEI